MFPEVDSLTPVQQQVLDLLSSGTSVGEAARQAGIHRNTIANWRRDSSAFRDCATYAQQRQAAHWRDELQTLAPIAMRTLRQTMTGDGASAGVRLRAALAVLDKVTASVPLEPAPVVHPPQFEKPAQSCTTAPHPGSFEAVANQAHAILTAESACAAPETPAWK